MIELSNAVPPGFGADALLQVAASNRVPDAVKIELVADAFRMASNARLRSKLRLLDGETASREGALARAHELGLDELSLKCRAVRQMVSLDPAEARRLFESISLPAFEPRRCSETLVDDPRAYYQTIEALAREGFAPQEQSRGEPWQWLVRFTSTLTSPHQAEPLANLIKSLDPPADELSFLVNSYAVALDNVQADDRSFGNPSGLLSAVQQLSELCIRKKVQTDSLIRAVSRYLTRHYSGVRCADNFATLPPEQSAAMFNKKLRLPPFTTQSLPRIDATTVQPARLAEAAERHPYWQDGRPKELMAQIMQMRGESLTVETRQSSVWENWLRDLLHRLESWRGEEETAEMDYFHQKATVYFWVLAELTPAGPLREQWLLSYAAFLAGSGVVRENPAAWFLEAGALIRMAVDFVRESKEDGEEADPQEGLLDHNLANIVREFERSGNMILTLQSRLAKLSSAKVGLFQEESEERNGE